MRRALLSLWLVGMASPAAAQVAVDVGGTGGAVAENEIERQLAERGVTVDDGASVRITGRVRGSRLSLTASGPAGEIGQASFRGRNRNALLRDLRDGFWDQLGASVASATESSPGSTGGASSDAPAAAPTSTSTSSSTSTASAPPPDPFGGDEDDEERDQGDDVDESPPAARDAASSGAPRPDAIRTSATVGIYARDFSYVDDLFLELRGYSLPAVPVVRVRGLAHPLRAVSDETWAEILGLGIDVQLPFGVETEVGDNVYPTYAYEWSMALSARLPVERHAFAVSAAYAERAFTVAQNTEDQPRLDLPDVHYHELRFEADAWIDVEVMAFGIHGGWSVVVESGGIEQPGWFRRNRSHGAGVGAEVHVPLAAGLNVTALFDWRGYFFDMRAEPGDERVAGGAIDHHYTATLGLSYRGR